jgi:hypothetical protein
LPTKSKVTPWNSRGFFIGTLLQAVEIPPRLGVAALPQILQTLTYGKYSSAWSFLRLSGVAFERPALKDSINKLINDPVFNIFFTVLTSIQHVTNALRKRLVQSGASYRLSKGF